MFWSYSKFNANQYAKYAYSISMQYITVSVCLLLNKFCFFEEKKSRSINWHLLLYKICFLFFKKNKKSSHANRFFFVDLKVFTFFVFLCLVSLVNSPSSTKYSSWGFDFSRPVVWKDGITLFFGFVCLKVIFLGRMVNGQIINISYLLRPYLLL